MIMIIIIMISSSLSCANWVAASPKRNLAKNSWFNNLKRRYFPKIYHGYDQYCKGKVQVGRQQNKVSNRELWRKIYWSNAIKDNLTTKVYFLLTLVPLMLSWVVSDADTEGRESFFFGFSCLLVRAQKAEVCKMQRKSGIQTNGQPLEKVGYKRGTWSMEF